MAVSYRSNRERGADWYSRVQGAKFNKHLDTALRSIEQARFEATNEFAGEIRERLDTIHTKIKNLQYKTTPRRR